MHIYASTYPDPCIYVYIHIYIYMLAHPLTPVCVYMCIYVYAYTSSDPVYVSIIINISSVLSNFGQCS